MSFRHLTAHSGVARAADPLLPVATAGGVENRLRPTLQSTRRYRSSDGQTILGNSSLVVASLALGAVLLGYLQGSEIVPMFVTGSAGLVIAAGWCATTRHFAMATVYGVFAGFNLSYALLQLGVSNNWYAIPITSLTQVLSVYSIAWIALFVLLSFVAYSASLTSLGMFLATAAGLGLVTAANVRGSLTLLRWASVPVMVVVVFSVIGIGAVMRGWHIRNRIARERARGLPSSTGSGGLSEFGVSERRTPTRATTD